MARLAQRPTGPSAFGALEVRECREQVGDIVDQRQPSVVQREVWSQEDEGPSPTGAPGWPSAVAKMPPGSSSPANVSRCTSAPPPPRRATILRELLGGDGGLLRRSTVRSPSPLFVPEHAPPARRRPGSASPASISPLFSRMRYPSSRRSRNTPLQGLGRRLATREGLGARTRGASPRCVSSVAPVSVKAEGGKAAGTPLRVFRLGVFEDDDRRHGSSPSANLSIDPGRAATPFVLSPRTRGLRFVHSRRGGPRGRPRTRRSLHLRQRQAAQGNRLFSMPKQEARQGSIGKRCSPASSAGCSTRRSRRINPSSPSPGAPPRVAGDGVLPALAVLHVAARGREPPGELPRRPPPDALLPEKAWIGAQLVGWLSVWETLEVQRGIGMRMRDLTAGEVR